MPDRPNLPPYSAPAEAGQNGESTLAQSGTTSGRPRNRGRRVVVAGIGGAVVVFGFAAVAFSGGLAASKGHTQPSAGGPAVTQSTASTPSSPEATRRAYAPFDRPEYVQNPSLAGATGAVEATTVKVSADESGASMVEGMMGFSFEADVMADPRFEPGASTFVEELRKLHKPVVRFGGQAVDRRFFWTSTNEPIPADWKLVPAFTGDKRPIVKVTPADLQRLSRMAIAADARILLTADLGHYDPARAADLAKNAAAILGDRLLGVTVGNEPNGYYVEGNQYLTLRPKGWDEAKFLGEFKAYAAEIKKAAPTVKLVGPGSYDIDWLKAYTGVRDQQVGAVSYHHYPMSGCGGPGDPNGPTVGRTMSRERSDLNRKFLGKIAAVAKGADLPLWLTEGGLSACSGSNETARKHVSALWTAGYALMAAQSGVTQLDVHSAIDACRGGPPASPVCDTGGYKKPNGVIVGQANYAGMMLVSALKPGKFQVLDQSGSPDVYSYAIAHDDGSLSVVIVNQNDPAKFGQAPVRIQLPQAAATGTMSQMTAPTFESEALTRIDGRLDAGVPAEERAKIPGFVPGVDSVSLPLTSGTATVLNFTF